MARSKQRRARNSPEPAPSYSLWTITQDAWTSPLEGVVIDATSPIRDEQLEAAIKSNEEQFKYFKTPVTEDTLSRSVK